MDEVLIVTTATPVFDPLSQAFADDPYASYRELRAAPGPVYYEHFDVWLLSRYQDVAAAAADKTLVRSLEFFLSPEEIEEQKVRQNWHDMPNHSRFVQFSLLANAGYAADAGIKAGTARLTLDMLDEGAGRYDSLALAAAEESLGASISSGSTLDTSYVKLNALKAKLQPSLALYADVILRPTFAAAELERRKKLQLAAIQQENPFAAEARAQLLGALQRIDRQLASADDDSLAIPVRRGDNV